jgi:hypothetical protein
MPNPKSINNHKFAISHNRLSIIIKHLFTNHQCTGSQFISSQCISSQLKGHLTLKAMLISNHPWLIPASLLEKIAVVHPHHLKPAIPVNMLRHPFTNNHPWPTLASLLEKIAVVHPHHLKPAIPINMLGHPFTNNPSNSLCIINLALPTNHPTKGTKWLQVKTGISLPRLPITGKSVVGPWLLHLLLMDVQTMFPVIPMLHRLNSRQWSSLKPIKLAPSINSKVMPNRGQRLWWHLRAHRAAIKFAAKPAASGIHPIKQGATRRRVAPLL